MTGDEALANFTIAANFVRAGMLNQARAMKDKLLPSDWLIIERRIEAANAKGTKHDRL